MGKSYTRKTILINPPFQLRLAVGASLLAAAEILVGCIIMLTVAMMKIQMPPGDRVEFYYALVGTVGLAVLILTGVNFLAVVLVSHRIAGPAYRLKKSLDQVAAGDLTLLIHLREGDELQELKDAFNDMVNSLRDKVKAFQALLPAAKAQGSKPRRGRAGSTNPAARAAEQSFKLV